MRIYRARDYDDMSRKAAGLVSAQVIMKPTCVLGLATGGTPQGLYRLLADWHRSGDLDFAEAATVNLDEYRGLERTDPNSYHYFMEENLFRHINLSADRAHLPDGMAADPAAECARYNGVIAALGGIDLQVLGIGVNGHIGFNEPGPAFRGETHLVTLSESTLAANGGYFAGREMPTQAYTVGIKLILQAKRILLLANGKAKAAALKEALYGPITPALPASVLQLHSDVVVVADEEALSALA